MAAILESDCRAAVVFVTAAMEGSEALTGELARMLEVTGDASAEAYEVGEAPQYGAGWW